MLIILNITLAGYGKYLQPSNSPLSFRRKKSLEINYLDVQDKQQQQQQQNNPYNFIPNISEVKNNLFYDIYDNTLTDLTESRDALSNNFFQENAAMIASLIEKYQEKMQSYLSIKEINEFIMPFIVIPLFSIIIPKRYFFILRCFLTIYSQVLEFRRESTLEYLVLLIYSILLNKEDKNK